MPPYKNKRRKEKKRKIIIIIHKKITKKDDGTYESVWSLSEDQINFLLTFAINSLLQEGLLNIEEVEEGVPDRGSYLESLKVEDMPQS